MLVNVLGSALAGLLLGATTYQTVSPTTSALLLTGFLGGFTTASTLAYEGARLVQTRRYAGALLVLVGTMVVSVLVAIMGLVIGGA
jgi:CrcB protein